MGGFKYAFSEMFRPGDSFQQKPTRYFNGSSKFSRKSFVFQS